MSSFGEYQEVDSYWYDQVPANWKKTKNKYVFSQDKHVVGEDWEKFTLLTMGKSGVKPRDMDGGGKFPASFENYQTVEPDQLIFCLFDLDETPRTIGMSKDYGMITSAYDVFSTTEGDDPQFWTYFYHMIDDHKGLRPFYTGLRKVVRPDTFMGIEVFSPPLEEQKIISRYLDKKTEQIDRLVEKIQKKIELLKEQRTSLINQCVTKGLDPNVEMKDSGVEWIGEIPKHWEFIRLKYLFSLEGGKDPKLVETEGGRYPILGTGGEISRSKDFLYDKPTLLLGRKGTIDKPFLVSEPFWVSDVMYYTVQKTEMSPDYLLKLFNLIPFGFYEYGSTQPSMSRTDYESMYFPCPKKEERHSITNYLNEESLKIDTSIEKEIKKTSLLKEYRQSLISSVVTGKVRVTEDMV